MRHLVFIFKYAFALLPLLSGCASSPSAPVDQARLSGPYPEQKSLKISPPAGSDREEKKARQGSLDQLMKSSPNTHDIDAELKLPASVLGLKEAELSDDPFLRSRQDSKMLRSDQEISASFGGNELEKNMGDVDRSLNLSEEQPGPLKPSYLKTTQRIRALFASQRFEDALVETNELLLHYPSSSLLWTMKGTLHLRLRNTELSLASYEKAFEIDPSTQLQAQIADLRRRVNEREQIRNRREPAVVSPAEVIEQVQPDAGGPE